MRNENRLINLQCRSLLMNDEEQTFSAIREMDLSLILV